MSRLTVRDRSFAIAGPRGGRCNIVRKTLQSASSLTTCHWRLKHIYFSS